MRDTQVGLKVFSRRVVEQVMPLLLVKRFAFDLELLAVGKALGYGRIRELPVRLDYRFTGSGVGSMAVLLALWDTAAIFYRLRVLRTYERKRRFLHGTELVPPEAQPVVSFVGDAGASETLDYPRLEFVDEGDPSSARGDIVAMLGAGARPAGNWVSAAVPYFSHPEVAAVVVPTVAPLRASLRQRVAAAVLESRLGSGSRRTSYFPGNLRIVADYPAESVVVRRADLIPALDAGVDEEELVAWLDARGRRTVYTPDTSLAATPMPMVMPHLLDTIRPRACTRCRCATYPGAKSECCHRVVSDAGRGRCCRRRAARAGGECGPGRCRPGAGLRGRSRVERDPRCGALPVADRGSSRASCRSCEPACLPGRVLPRPEQALAGLQREVP